MSGCARHAATLIRLPFGCAVCAGAVGGRTLAFHAHRSHVATIALGGVRRFVLGEGQKLSLAPGAVLLIPSGMAHATAPSARAARAVSLSLPPVLAPTVAARGAGVVFSPELAEAIVRMVENPPVAADLRAVVAALCAAPPPSPPPADVRKARDRLENGGLAVRPTAGFGHRFRRHFGMSPSAWRGLSRVRRAGALLAAGKSLAAAAVDAGFYDQSHMTRQFLRFLGLTPGEYRAGFAVGAPPLE